jgi:GT2 family glycosyltransferase
VHDDRGLVSNIGVVIIGRNEGERLRTCLVSVVQQATIAIYVDSGSADDSVNMARTLGVEVIELDLNSPFTAARARNEGFRRLCDMHENITYVQFVDGDCELVIGWLASAANFLSDHEGDVAVVSGRLRERYPAHSIYNTLCDIEWDRPIGEVKACGGIAMIRVDAFERAQGFRVDLIAGEEPELCVRLRTFGWRIWRLGEEMALHDSAMLHFGQWWKRMRRGGYAFAQGAHLHGASPERHSVRESQSALFWGLGMPLIAIISTSVMGPIGLVTLAVYPYQIVRLALRGARSTRDNWWYAVFLVMGKFPEMLVLLQFFMRRWLGRQSRLIEHK